MTFFSVKNYADEYLQALDKGFKPTVAMTEPDETVAATVDDIIESTRDFILKELSKNLKGYALEEFVADLLRAMGYRCTLSPHGGDSGIDITAYKDELPPRIIVQVKSQDSDIKVSAFRTIRRMRFAFSLTVLMGSRERFSATAHQRNSLSCSLTPSIQRNCAAASRAARR